jgi:hypothetical protein
VRADEKLTASRIFRSCGSNVRRRFILQR